MNGIQFLLENKFGKSKIQPMNFPNSSHTQQVLTNLSYSSICMECLLQGDVKAYVGYVSIACVNSLKQSGNITYHLP
jgi:hypothetical protein